MNLVRSLILKKVQLKMIKEIYSKTIKLAAHKSSSFFLGLVSFIESFIFPIPPDVLIIPMTIAKKQEWIKIALIATIGSVLGACLGYFIGYVFFNEIGIKIFELYGVDNTSFLKDKISSEGGVIAWMTILAIAGFSPIPFKLLTITSGFVHFNLLYFIIVSLITRGSRFFIIAFLIGNFGSAMKKIIEKKLLKVSMVLSIILIIFAYLIYKLLVNFIS
jgi:membrane protein YqaA with SNARE-associated domain